MITMLAKLLGGGVLDRVLDTINKKVDSETDREALRTEAVREHMRTRPDWLRAGGFWLLVIAGAPFIYHVAWVCFYSVHWCADCHAPVNWTVAALPEPFDEYQGWIIMAYIGGLSLFGLPRKTR